MTQSRVMVAVAGVILLSMTRAYAFDDTDLVQFVEGRLASIHTKGHPNAQQINLSLTYPMTWDARLELDAPLVAQIISDEGRGRDGCNLSITKVATAQQAADVKDDFIAQASNDEFNQFVPAGFALLTGNSVAIDDLPALQLLLSEHDSTSVAAYRFYVLSYIYVNGRYVIVNCGTVAKDRDQALFQFKNELPVFAAIANSIRVYHSAVPAGS